MSGVTPIDGYREQSPVVISLVNDHKQLEEHLLQAIDRMQGAVGFDQRWLAIARTHIEQGFMALNRAVLQPHRVKLRDT